MISVIKLWFRSPWDWDEESGGPLVEARLGAATLQLAYSEHDKLVSVVAFGDNGDKTADLDGLVFATTATGSTDAVLEDGIAQFPVGNDGIVVVEAPVAIQQDLDELPPPRKPGLA